MKIKTVSCRQFAGLRNIEPVEFEDGMNVLYGHNESGKSTLLELIYSLLWQSSKVGKGSVDDKEYRRNCFPADTRSGISGTTIDGKLVLEADGGRYTISKKWWDKGTGELETPQAILDENADAVAYAETMKKLLTYGKGVYREAIFANQRTIDGVIRALLEEKLNTDLSSVASATLLDMGGVSSEKFMSSIERKMKELDNSWDWSTNGPKGGRGIDNRIKQNVGTILNAFYEREDIKSRLKKLQDASDAIVDADAAHEQALTSYQEAEEESATFQEYYASLEKAQNIEKNLKLEKDEYDRRIKGANRWPQCERELERAKALCEELAGAESVELWKKVAEVCGKKEEDEKALASLVMIDEADIASAKTLSENIQRLEKKLRNFSALLSFSLSQGYEIKVTSDVDGRPIEVNGSSIDLNEAVCIEIPGVAVFHLSAADLDVEKVNADIRTMKAELTTILHKYDVETVDELKNTADEISYKRRDLEQNIKTAEKNYKELLKNETLEEVKEKYEKAVSAKTRERSAIENEIRTMTEKPITTFRDLLQQEMQNLIREYGSREENDAKIQSLKENIQRSEEELKMIDDIPEDMKNIGDPQAKKVLLENAKQSAETKKNETYKALADKRAKMKALEEDENYLSVEELKEAETDADRRFEEYKAEYEAWKQIKAAADSILNASSSNPLQSFEDDFRTYLAAMSEDKLSLASMSKKLGAELYSGENKMTYTLLSEGTKDTIALAFRLAVINFLYPDGGGFVVFDDPFTDMDEDRKAKACELVKEFAQKHQVIFVTCDASYGDILGGNMIRFER